MCAMFIILVAFASVKMAFDSVPLALFSRASGLIGTEYTVEVYYLYPKDEKHKRHYEIWVPIV